MTPIPPAQLLEALRWRYATRTFDPARRIAPNLWRALEESLVLSASSFGLQPYRFIVVDDPAKRAALLPHAWGQRQVVDASHFVVLAGRTAITAPEIDALMELTATTRGVSVASLAGYRGLMAGTLLSDHFRAQAPQWAAHQVYLALGNLLTTAALLGVDACPMEGLVPAEFDRLLALPEQGLTTVVACAFGYRSSADKYATLPKVRPPHNALIQSV